MRARDIDFLIIGAAKCATTWLQRSLQADPTVSMPDPEIHYFSRFYDRGHDWYFDQFPRAVGGALVGEKSNSYLDTPVALPRMRGLLPHAKLVVQLRNPVDRAYSDYCMLYRRGEVGRSIAAYLSIENASHNRFLRSGLYHQHVQACLDHYPRESLLILFYEKLDAQPERQLGVVREFLGLPAEAGAPLPVAARAKNRAEPIVGPRLRKIFAPLKPVVRPFRGNPVFAAARHTLAREIAYPPLSPELRSRLIDFYAADVAGLGALTRRDLSGWLTGTPNIPLPAKPLA
jgi:sulfotransferase family protein